jgi:hypothetical protein
MPGQHGPDFSDRFYQCITEVLILEIRPHSLRDALPEFVAALLVNRFVTDDRELVNARCHKDQHTIALARVVHTKPAKLPLRGDEGIALQLPALNQDANLTGRFGFGFPNRLDDPVVLEFAEEFPGSH